MGRGLLIVVCTAFLGGCALPLPIQIASWAIDGISLLATEKSITDHGISMVTQKDCALWRGVTGKDICVNNTDDAGTVLLAARDSQQVSPFAPDPVVVTSIAAANPTTEVSVAVPTFDPVPAQLETVSAEQLPPVEAVAVIATVVEEKSVEPVIAMDTPDGSDRLLIPGRRAWTNDRSADLYMVIGSFSERDNARHFVRSHAELGPAVMASRLDGKEVYRVAVGPFVGPQKTEVGRKIKAAGLSGSWAMRIDHKDWMIAAAPSPKMAGPLAEVAPIPVKATLPIVPKPEVDELASVGSGAASTPTAPGYGKLFYVIGSFDVAKNARSFATETLVDGVDSFQPVVISSKTADRWQHRVVVGPFGEEDRDRVRGELAAAGINEPWSIRLPRAPLAYRIKATSLSTPEIAGTAPALPGTG